MEAAILVVLSIQRRLHPVRAVGNLEREREHGTPGGSRRQTIRLEDTCRKTSATDAYHFPSGLTSRYMYPPYVLRAFTGIQRLFPAEIIAKPGMLARLVVFIATMVATVSCRRLGALVALCVRRRIIDYWWMRRTANPYLDLGLPDR